MHVGFTGTQQGATEAQLTELTLRLAVNKTDGRQFHHGDCVGSDEQAAGVARSLKYEIHCHPPANSRKRAYYGGDVMYRAAPYLTRNRHIVDATGILIAIPRGFEEELRSGTWSTVRYARQVGRKVVIIYPDGSVEVYKKV